MTLLSTGRAVSAPVPPSPPATAGTHTVPWSTVLPLAVVLCYADGFWLGSLQGAVGAIERIQEPVAAYWRTSTLVLPVFVLAVLGALTCALRRSGELRDRRSLVVTALLVAAAGALAGVLVAVGSSLYDYRLQVQHLSMMGATHGGCDAACVDRQQVATLAAHGRAIGYAGAAMLVTNVALVGWVVALRGGRLAVAGTGSATTAGGRARDVRLLLVVSLVASAVIHAAAVPEHLDEWAAAGLFFVLLAVAQVLVADRVLRAPRPLPVAAAAVVSLLPLAVWVVSRTAGLPFGPEAGSPEAVGLADVVAGLLEVGTLVAAAVLLRRGPWLQRPRWSAHARALALVAVVAVTAMGVGGVAPAWVDGGDGAAPVMETGHHR